MSLISDALRKARQEAAEREAKERGLESPVVAGYWKRGGRLGAALVLGAAIAMGAAVIGGGLVWWALADRSDSTAVDGPNEGVQAEVEVVEESPVTSNGDQAPDPPQETMAPTVTPVESRRDDHDVSPVVEDDAVTRVEVSDRTPDREEAVPAEVPSPQPQPQPQVAEGEFVGEARIGGITLTLDYLVFRKENPFAQINGQDVFVGGVVEDHVVEAITADSVVLTQGDAKIVLRVH
ncbi:MAG: hypothetical protein ABFS37_13580 [Acidobacteriota bacterium]